MTTQSFPEFFREWKQCVVAVQHQGRSCLTNRGWQPGGKRPYLPATPEEFVRQGFIAYLLDRLGLPHRCLRIEKGVPTLGNGGAEAKARGRFDLVLYKDDRPLLLVEFKRETETESLIQTAYRQAREYAQGLPGIRFVLLCNGRITRLFSVEGGN